MKFVSQATLAAMMAAGAVDVPLPPTMSAPNYLYDRVPVSRTREEARRVRQAARAETKRLGLVDQQHAAETEIRMAGLRGELGWE